MTEPVYTVKWTKTASGLLDDIPDRRIQDAIVVRAGQLKNAPEQQGKALLGPLMGFRRVHAENRRYRIIYRVLRDSVVVAIVAVGLRKHGDTRDVYALAQKLFRQGLIAPVKKPKRRK